MRQSQNGFYFRKVSLHKPQRPASETLLPREGRTTEQLGMTRWLCLSDAGARKDDVYSKTVPEFASTGRRTGRVSWPRSHRPLLHKENRATRLSPMGAKYRHWDALET